MNIKLHKKTDSEGKVMSLDWEFYENGYPTGICQLADGADLIDDALYKGIISPTHQNGYGVGTQQLRGIKMEDLEEGFILLRIYRTLSALETWYGLKITPTSISIQENAGEIDIKIGFSVLGIEKEVHV